MTTGRSRSLSGVFFGSLSVISLTVSQPPHLGHFPIHLRVSWPHDSHMNVDLLFMLLMGRSAPSDSKAAGASPLNLASLVVPLGAATPPEGLLDGASPL